MGNQLKQKRREELGDKPTGERIMSNDPTSGIPAQPMPGMPQGKGNLTNFTAVDKEGQMGQQMGQGKNRYPYGDGGLSLADGRMGGVGFVENSGMNQNQVPGRRLNNQPYNTVKQTDEGTPQQMLYAQGVAKEAVTRAEKLYASSNDKTPSYQIGPMGILGTPVETTMQGNVNPGQFPMQMPSQSNMSMPLTGNTTAAIEQKGMSTGRGGGRNQKPNNA